MLPVTVRVAEMHWKAYLFRRCTEHFAIQRRRSDRLSSFGAESKTHPRHRNCLEVCHMNFVAAAIATALDFEATWS